MYKGLGFRVLCYGHGGHVGLRVPELWAIGFGGA